MTTTLPASNRILLAAIEDYLAKPGALQKHIAIDLDFGPNNISMLKKGTYKVPLARVPDFKRALPTLDAVDLTAAILSEMKSKSSKPGDQEKAQEAIIELIEFFCQQPPLELKLLEIAAEIREEDGKSGLPIPDKLPAHIRAGIKALLKAAVQHEAKAVFGDIADV